MSKAREGFTTDSAAARPFDPRHPQLGPGRGRSFALLAGTALAGVLAALSPGVALADGGEGGRSPYRNGTGGGAGGAGYTGQAGSQPAFAGSSPTAGGGGGAAGGGAGGAGGYHPSGVAGVGGQNPSSMNGGNGSDGVYNSNPVLMKFSLGGGGGAGGLNGATFSAPGTISASAAGQAGGNGGNGGSDPNDLGAGGGGGGAGGYGLILTGTGTATIAAGMSGGAGGTGGAGGNGLYSGGVGGSGGDGGVGLQVTGSVGLVNNTSTIFGGTGGNGGATGTGSAPLWDNPGGNGGKGGDGVRANNVTLNNTGTISGGDGGLAGTGPAGNGAAGAGGAGVVGSGLTIINSGTISGGLADAGNGARANAITFTGGTNVLTSNSGTLTGNIGVTGSLTLLQTTAGGTTGSASYANIISGTGALIVTTDANKTVTLTGANTHTGGTTISAGTLQIGNGGTAGTLGTGAVVDDGALVFDRSDAITVSNAISGTGTLRQQGGGTLTLTGALSYTGLTTVAGGDVILGDATHSVTLPGDATLSGGNLAVANGSLGAGTITINGGRSLVVGLTPGLSATAGSTTIVNGGTVAFQNAGSAGTATITNTGLVDFADTSTAANARITSTGGGLLQFRNTATAGTATIGTGTGSSTTFGNQSTAGAATITTDAGGLLTFQGQSTAGAATIVTNGGAALDSTGTLFTDNATGGTSRQIVNTGGLLDISQATSGVTIGSLEGAGRVALGGKTLTIGANDLSTAFSGVIQNLGNLPGSGTGTGGLTKIGAGTLTLTGTNTYTGATQVAGGTLIINGAIATSSGLTVDAGATVGGTGTLPTTVIAGTLSPGNSIGTITVAGNLTFTSTGTYKVEVSPSAADRTNVTGTATLAGTVSALFQPGTYVTRNYVILSAAGGLAGTTFAALSTANLPAGFLAKLSYTSTDVVLDLTAALGSVQGLNRNQQAVATSLGNAFNAGAALPPAFLGVFGLTGTPLRTALSQLSGEPATGAIQAGLQATGTFLGLMLDPFVAARSGASAGAGGPALAFAGDTAAANAAAALPADAARAYAAAMPGVYGKAPPTAHPAPQWTVWGAAFGGNGRVDGDAATGSHDLDARVFGVAAGADYRVSPDAVLGFALAGGGTRWTTAGLGDGKTDTAQAGLYGSQKFGPAFVSAALAYAWHDATTTRMVSVAGETLEGRFRPQVFGARLEAGWRFGGPALGLTPYAAGQVQAFRMPGFAETATAGAGSFALSYADETVTAPRSELGAWADARTATRLGELILRGRAAWAHDFETDRRLTPTFQALPTASFVVAGAAPDADLALLSAAAELRLASGVTLIGKADGEFGAHTRALAGTGTLRITW